MLDHSNLFTLLQKKKIFNLLKKLAPIEDIFKVDGGDCVYVSSLLHAASNAPTFGVRVELQDIIIPSDH